MKISTRFTALMLLIFGVVLLAQPQKSEAQALRLLTSNTLSGAATGATLSAATMALQNEVNWDYLRYGIGFGTLGGLGLGIYDVMNVTGGDYYVDGIFSSTTHSSAIILLDTFYGSATGAIVGAAIGLISSPDNILNGVRIGAGVGAWVGFGFGLVDAFVFSAHVPFDDFFDDFAHNTPVRGFLQYHPTTNIGIGAINPTMYYVANLEQPTSFIHGQTGVELAMFNVRF